MRSMILTKPLHFSCFNTYWGCPTCWCLWDKGSWGISLASCWWSRYFFSEIQFFELVLRCRSCPLFVGVVHILSVVIRLAVVFTYYRQWPYVYCSNAWSLSTSIIYSGKLLKLSLFMLWYLNGYNFCLIREKLGQRWRSY